MNTRFRCRFDSCDVPPYVRHNSGAAGACAGRPKVLGASAGEAGIETGDPPQKTGTTTKVTPFLRPERPPPNLGR